MASLTGANGNIASCIYDLLGRVTDITKNSGKLRYQYARDASGMISETTLADPAYAGPAHRTRPLNRCLPVCTLHHNTCGRKPFRNWLGREGSNLRMPESKSGALPLGDAPVVTHV